MKVEVYHDRHPTFTHTTREDCALPGKGTPWPDRYDRVATVQAPDGLDDAEALEHAFAVTQNVDAPWTEAPDVEAHGTRHRSTSVGDVIVVREHIYRCEPFGWVSL